MVALVEKPSCGRLIEQPHKVIWCLLLFPHEPLCILIPQRLMTSSHRNVEQLRRIKMDDMVAPYVICKAVCNPEKIHKVDELRGILRMTQRAAHEVSVRMVHI